MTIRWIVAIRWMMIPAIPPRPRNMRYMMRRGLILAALVLLIAAAGPAASHAQDGVPASDTLLITSTTQGVNHLPHTGITVEIPYASVITPTHLTITRTDAQVTIKAIDTYGVPLDRFEVPVVIALPTVDGVFPQTARAPDITALPVIPAASAGDSIIVLAGWPAQITVLPVEQAGEPDADTDTGRWYVIFDAHGIYAQPAWGVYYDSMIYLGPLEHFAPDMVEHDPAFDTITYLDLPSPADIGRYRDRFVPEDRTNPGAYRVLGWVYGDRLPDIARALRATIPDDPDLPAPGEPYAPIDLILPFDCAQPWVVTWGYHHSTPQNRFAVDFAADYPNGAQGQPAYAAHAGTVFLKRYGTPEHMIEMGFAVRVAADDGITSTVYGHMDPPGTLALWGVSADDVPDYEWVEVGKADQGQVIGITGRAGYATGAHIHFALWSWDQSLYQPVPLGPLTDFVRGMVLPPHLRDNCSRYR
ncbi:MAG: M23 family metallopeptidase [Anaerolineae bacterium]|nr:M23 family metallopeptidase [Anaerolineae bacterium]